MHAGAVACSVREVCICKFHCHACRSSGLFSPWSMYLQISLVMHARAVVILLVLIEFVLLQWPIQFVIYIYIFSSWSIFIYHLASAHGSLSSCCYDDLFSSWSIFIYSPCLFVPLHVRRRSGYSTDSYGLLSSCCFDDWFSSWSIFIYFLCHVHRRSGYASDAYSSLISCEDQFSLWSSQLFSPRVGFFFGAVMLVPLADMYGSLSSWCLEHLFSSWFTYIIIYLYWCPYANAVAIFLIRMAHRVCAIWMTHSVRELYNKYSRRFFFLLFAGAVTMLLVSIYMHVSVCVCVCVCACVCVCVCACVCACALLYVYLYQFICIRACVYACKYVYIFVRVYLRV